CRNGTTHDLRKSKNRKLSLREVEKSETTDAGIALPVIERLAKPDASVHGLRRSDCFFECHDILGIAVADSRGPRPGEFRISGFEGNDSGESLRQRRVVLVSRKRYFDNLRKDGRIQRQPANFVGTDGMKCF